MARLADLVDILIDQAQDGGIEQADKTWLGTLVADILGEFKNTGETIYGDSRRSPFGGYTVAYSVQPVFEPFKGTFLKFSWADASLATFTWTSRNIYTGGVFD